jgi:hypothetical protein
MKVYFLFVIWNKVWEILIGTFINFESYSQVNLVPIWVEYLRQEKRVDFKIKYLNCGQLIFEIRGAIYGVCWWYCWWYYYWYIFCYLEQIIESLAMEVAHSDQNWDSVVTDLGKVISFDENSH